MTDDAWVHRWRSLEDHDPHWDARTIVVANAVRGPRVIEFGAGRCTARETLVAKGMYYYATDAFPSGLCDRVVDLNWEELPTLPRFDSALMSGVLEYVSDLPRCFEWLRSVADELVFTYVPAAQDLSLDEFGARSRYWHSHYSIRGLVDALANTGASTALLGQWNEHAVIRAVWREPQETP